jgi:uncharacterized protein YjeT (DUF2065 family)
MPDFVAALGLMFALEGLMFAAFPAATKRAMANALEMPESVMRLVGVASAALGVLIIWLVRG